MRLQLLFILTSLLFAFPLSTLEINNFKCEFIKSPFSENQGIYTVYDLTNGIMHLVSFVGQPTFLIYRTNLGADSLNYTWDNATDVGIRNVNISSFELLYGFVARSIIEFNVSSGSVDFNLTEYYKNSSSFKTTSLSNLQYNLTDNTDCNKTGKVHVSIMQKNISSNATQLNLIFDLKAFSQQGRLNDQPRYAYRGNNSVIEFTIRNFQYNLTNATMPASRLAIELDFLRYQSEQLVFSSEANIDDEYTPAVFIQNTISNKFQGNYFYWKPIAYASGIKTVENSMMVTFLNGSLNNNVTMQLNTTGFYKSLHNNIPVILERTFFLFGTDGDSTLNSECVVFRAELGIGTPPTDYISLPLLVAIGVGFGLPVLGLALGFVGMFCFLVYKCCFRKSTRNARYVSIN